MLEMGCLPLLRKLDLLEVCYLKELLHFLTMLLKSEKERNHVRYCLGLILKQKIL